MPGFIDFERSFRSALTDSNDYEFEFYIDCMDLIRFPDKGYHDRLVELYREKYSDLKIDLIVALLHSSLDFLSKYGPESFHNVPAIYFRQDFRPITEPTPMPVAATVTGRLDIQSTLSLAMKLHPNARKVFIVTGASGYDQTLERMAREELSGFETHVELHSLSGLPMAELIHRVANLPEHSLVLYVAVFRNGAKQAFESREALALIARQANAPIYSVSETYIASGIVGGHLTSYSALGARVARAVLRVLAGEKPEDRGIAEQNGNRYIFNARQLERWEINEDSLPQGSDVRYRDLSPWETYRWQILGTVSIFIFQALLISALVISLRKQRRVDRALRQAESKYRSVAEFTHD